MKMISYVIWSVFQVERFSMNTSKYKYDIFIKHISKEKKMYLSPLISS